ncbi:MAG: AcrR family transcriptional regulator [Myxococcota bacterium]|jgi:AcrR family transcriptional regulator
MSRTRAELQQPSVLLSFVLIAKTDGHFTTIVQPVKDSIKLKAPAKRKKTTRRRVGRPRKEDAFDTRGAILTTAVDLFGRHGQDGASIRGIADGAGVSMSTLFHHFGDKQGLFNACVDATYTRVDGLREHFGAAVTSAQNAHEAFRPLVRAALVFAFEHRAFVRVVLAAGVTTGRIPPHVREQVSAPMLAQVGPLLATLTGQSIETMRAVAMSFNHLVARYAVTDPVELAGHLGVDATLEGETRQAAILEALERHLVQLFEPQLG